MADGVRWCLACLELKNLWVKARAGSTPAPGTIHPIEGNFTTYSGEQCLYHMQGGAFFGKTTLERCYATETDAVRDGCRPLEQASLKRSAR